MIYIDIERYMIWYYLLSILILIITGYASIRHKKAIPFMWGLILSIVLIIFAFALEPILFGVLTYYNINWYMWGLTSAFMILWGLLLTINLWNCIKNGNVVN